MDKTIIFSYDVLHSTNDKAWELLVQKKSRVPFIVKANKQLHGKGRYGRKWASDVGGLYFSIVEKDRLNNELLVCTTLALYNMFKRFNIRTKIILPNDIYTENGKIAGILIERRASHTVNGIGINVNQKTFPKLDRKVTSMFLESGKPYTINTVLNAFVEEYFHTDYVRAFSHWKNIVIKNNKRLKLFTHRFTGNYTLKEIDEELNLYFDNLPMGKRYINLFDVIKINTLAH